MGSSTSSNVELSGRSSIDATALERAAQNPPGRECSICQSCNGKATPADLWQATWTYFFVPNRVLAVLIPIATATGLAFFYNYTRQVTHRTYHVICANCASSIRRDRVLGFLLRFVGLFAALCGLASTLAAVCWWLIANAHDRATIQTWIAVPLVMLVGGSLIARFGSSVSVPAAIRSMRRRPFHLTAFRRHVAVSAAK